MTAEYTVGEGQTVGELARELLDTARELDRDPSVIAWTPRPDTDGGGVFVVTDTEVAQRVLERRQRRAEAAPADAEAGPVEAPTTGEPIVDQTGVEPAEQAGAEAADAPQTTAQKRRAARQAKAQANGETGAQEPSAEETPAGDAQTEEAPAEADAEQKSE